MCLGIPMKILTIDGDSAVVSAGSTKRKCDISLITNPRRGDYLLIHAGFAIEKINPKEAKKTIKLIRDISPLSGTVSGL